MAPLITSRKAKFDVHLKILDLNNVPLASGESQVKWQVRHHKIPGDHKSGETNNCPIIDRRVEYNYATTINHVRLSVDSKTNYLSDCPLEFEVTQAFTGHDKTTLGILRLNLTEYVEESEAFLKDTKPISGPGPAMAAAMAIAQGAKPSRRRSSSVGISPTNSGRKSRKSMDDDSSVPDGVVRRYLLQESKVNSTLKVSILMVQVEGDRNFIAPPLRSAPTFGGIAGIMANEQADDDMGPAPSISKSRDAGEIQDLYRRTLIASWCRLPNEPAVDESIEDIFSGGNGWRARHDSSNTESEEDTDFARQGTLRPSDFKRVMAGRHRHGGHNHHHRHATHQRTQSGSSDKSASTVTGRKRGGRLDGKESETSGLSRSGSLGSLAPSLGSDRGRGDRGHKHAIEVTEDDVRDDLVAWSLRLEKLK